MTTTLIEARTALHRLSGQFPEGSTYAAHLSVLSDYFDNQVPLNVENRALVQRIAVLEAETDAMRKAISDDPGIVTISMPAPVFVTSDSNALRPDVGNRRFLPIDCTAWMGAAAGPCKCPVHAQKVKVSA